MEKPIDYLKEIRSKKKEDSKFEEKSIDDGGVAAGKDIMYNYKIGQKNNKWEKMLYNEKNTLLENIQEIKNKTRAMENDVKMKENILNLGGKSNINAEMESDVSDKIIDLIRAKLTILETIDNPAKVINNKKTKLIQKYK